MRTRAVAWLVQTPSGKPELFLDRNRAEQRAVDTHGVLHDLFTHPPRASKLEGQQPLTRQPNESGT